MILCDYSALAEQFLARAHDSRARLHRIGAVLLEQEAERERRRRQRAA